MDNNNDGVVDYYTADIMTAQDYYPFGMTMPGRSYNNVTANNSSYRYGYQGQEHSQEINNDDYTAEHWEYDARLGRRWNVDPMSLVDTLVPRTPQISPYACMLNNPVRLVDNNGDSADDIHIKGANNSSLTIKTDAVDLTINTKIDFGSNITLTDLSHVAIGSQISGTATGAAGTGTSANVSIVSTLFLGGKDAGYWYDYVGAEGQVVGETGYEATAGVAKSWFIAFNNSSLTNNAQDFAGGYHGGGGSFHAKDFLAGLSLNAQYSVSNDKTWSVLYLGASFTVGPQEDIFAGFGVGGEAHMGTTKLLTPEQPTSERSWWDIGANWFDHIIF